MEYFDDIVFVDVQLRRVGEFDQKLTYFLAGILNFDHGGKSQRWVNKQCPEEFGRRRKDKLMGLMGDRIFEHAKLVFSHAIKRNVFIRNDPFVPNYEGNFVPLSDFHFRIQQ